MMLKPMSAQTVTLVAADLAPKLDLLTAKIDENNKAMNDVDRKIETAEERHGAVEEEVTEKLMMFQRDLMRIKDFANQTRHEVMDYLAGSDDDDSDDDSDEEGPG